PNTSSPRSVWLTYTCNVPDTTTVPKNGLTGSFTAASRGEVVTGICTPAISEMSEDQQAVQLTVVSVAILPCEVRTPVTLTRLISMPVTSVYLIICNPISCALRDSTHTTASWRIVPPGGW